MRLEGIQIGDIVEVDRLGRRFHALVTGNPRPQVAGGITRCRSAPGLAQP
jgi:hypothetical protein